MKTLVVYESMYGNTQRIAEAVAAALSPTSEVAVLDVASAPATIPPGVEMLVVGGPTHAFSMSRAQTRQQAALTGGRPTDLQTGIREWLGALTVGSPGPAVATFDTRVRVPLLPGSAAKGAARLARRLGLSVQSRESFYVRDQAGPLLDGELDRAADWARSLWRSDVAG